MAERSASMPAVGVYERGKAVQSKHAKDGRVATRRPRRSPGIAADQLTPFKSFLVLRTAAPEPADGLVPLLDQLTAAVRDRGGTSVSSIAGPAEDENIHFAFFTYVEERRVGWARGSDLRDRLNHVVLACRGKEEAGGYVAFFCSDNAVRDKAAEKIAKGEGALGRLAAIPPSAMNAAFVNGQAVTLWMSGTHRRVATKADSKVLSGVDLQYALDPLEDQSFFFTAARCLVRKRGLDQPVGSSPRRSRLWVGPSRDWEDFSTGVRVLLHQLARKKRGVVNPLPILAEPILDAQALKAVRSAYDAALIPPELLDPSSASADAIDLRERVGRVVLEPSSVKGPNFSMRVRRADGVLLGTLDITFTVASNGSAQWIVSNDDDRAADTDLFASILRALTQHRAWLKVWYDSGHTLADEAFFETRFRDQPFQDYTWETFKGIDIKKEKPSPLSAATIGAQDSLFCWVKKRWAPPGSPPGRGWLACDDGSMEKADFVHLDVVGGVQTLSLIHVKASGAREPDRGVSVSDYEIVTSQAVKNLRWLDQATLAGGLAGKLRGRIGDKVWHDGKRSSAEEFARRVTALGANCARHVVILQPRLTKAAELAGRAAPRDSAERLRLLQLDALLLGARADVQGLNARLLVIGDAGL